jgi:GNAT superfamily N-acetyltransferase
MNINIRHANEGDIERLLEMGSLFWENTPYATTGMEYHRESVHNLFVDMINEHYIVVAETPEGVVGFLGYFIAPFTFHKDYVTATEVFYWVDPEYRGIGSEFLRIVEEDLKDGVDIINMAELSTSSDLYEFYTERDYVPTEQVYSKVV